MSNDYGKKRNASIEILRIVGCVLVIWAHMQLSITENGYFYKGRLFIASVIADDVPIFLLITGFFLFRKNQRSQDILDEFKRKLLGFLEKIWIPSVILVVITCILTPIIDGTSSWSNIGIWWNQINWDSLVGFVFKNSASGYSGHLWYICFYLKMLIAFPLLKFLCQDIRSLNIIRRIYLGIAFGNILVKDLAYFYGGNSLIDLSSLSLDEDFTYIILGFEIYLIGKNALKKWSRKKVLLGSAVAYFLGLISKMGLQALLYYMIGADAERRFMGLECLACYLTSASLLLFFSNIEWNFSEKLEKVILFLAQKTMLIYLFHMMVLMGTNGIREKILNLFHNGTTPFTALGYYVFSGGVVFGVSLIVAVIFDFIYNKVECKIRNILKIISEGKK